MPQCKTAATMQQLCINSIAKNLSYWTQDYEEKFMDKGRFRHLLGPFDDIPSPMLVQELADELIRQRKLTRSSLHLLINGGTLQHLDFSICPRLVTDEVVYMIADKCKKVKTLNLTRCGRITTQAFEILSSNLPYAVRLDFSWTRIGTLALQTLFRSCSDLQELTLRHCQVCDNDVGVLCNMVMQKERFRLHKLDLSSTMVTDMGVRALLRCIPHLQELQYSNLIGCIIAESPITEEFENQYLIRLPVIENTSKDTQVDRQKGQNSLKTLECTDFSSVSDHHLKLITFLCPELVSLDLRFARGFSNKGLSDLLCVRHLRVLRLASSDQLTFDSGLLNYLTVRGDQLEVLSLEDFDGLDLTLIGRLCPRIRKLLVFMMSEEVSFTTRENVPGVGHRMFQHLEELALWCINTNTSLTSGMLKAVLPQCHSLRSLEVIRVAALTDDVLQEAIQSHGFVRLKTLTLHECNAVSNVGISELVLDHRNVLDSLFLMDCFAITRRDYEGWCKLAKKRNYNLHIAWK